MFSAIFFIVSRLLTRAISNLALQAIEKFPDVSRNSARCKLRIYRKETIYLPCAAQSSPGR